MAREEGSTMDESTSTAGGSSAGGSAGRTVASGRGFEWWSESWALFVKAAGMWIVLGILLFIIYAVLSVIPFLGGLAGTVLFPVFIASWMTAARKVENGGALEFGDLFSAFSSDKLTPLLIVGALFMAFALAIMLVAVLLGIGAVVGVASGGADRSLGAALAALSAGMLAFLAAFGIGIVASMALWFAPALVVFRGTAPVDAMRISFTASLKNIVPFLLYSVIALVAMMVAAITFGLGFVLLVPLAMITLYVSYRDVFGA
jgi:uncharacterized membrane protein